MVTLYTIIVILLFVLAVMDLVVGVSNDAVNFLNSAIGSKVASRKVIMIVASLGILVGATFSSGMMEVARKGIFNPEFFVFGEIMIIFLAVMLTDIILLDFFNTVGLPTSTTVSIVFELLGAAVVMSIIKVIIDGEGITSIVSYINSSQAILIISGIFLSVIFAFLAGVFVQFISRILFTFRYQSGSKIVAALWGGLAMASMTYFLLLKGIAGASFATDHAIDWIGRNISLLMLGAFLCWTVIMAVLIMRKINVFRIIVFFGTFALAMAFAGNDLVNFIGVPIAGFESYLAWSGTGQDPFQYSAAFLQEPVRTESYMLVLAGLIMIVTLWFSKKARSVTDTEVNLGRQSEGHERFTPNALSQGIVRTSLGAAKLSTRVFSSPAILDSINRRFSPVVDNQKDKPAFDLIRASVNLTMASILISFATSLKLPLSTTYVSFMVAMGTSLADKAWGRDSAVYRVAGVLNVIGGWFVTAMVAFSVSGFFALLIYLFNAWAIGALALLAAYFIYRSFNIHKVKEKRKQARIAFETSEQEFEFQSLVRNTAGRTGELMTALHEIIDLSIDGLSYEDLVKLDKGRTLISRLLEKNEDFQYELYESIKRIVEDGTRGARMFV